MIGHRQLTIDDYLSILRRRFWLLIIPGVCCCAAAYLVSLKLANRYVSKTTVLVEGQRVPDSIVKPITAGDPNEQLASMKEQILSRTRLEPLVEQFNLFNDRGLRLEERVDELIKAISVDPIAPMAQTRSNSLPGFSVTVTLGDAHVAQLVCAEITSMFTNDSNQLRLQQAETATSFLDDQVAAAQQRMNTNDSKLASFKQQHVGMLPEQEQSNLNLLNGFNNQLDVVSQAQDRDKQNKIMWESMLSQQLTDWKTAKQAGQVVGVGLNPVTADDALKKKQEELTALEAKFGDEYPDVRHKKTEIEDLKKQIAASETARKTAAANQTNVKPVVDTSADASDVEPPQIQTLREQIKGAELSIQEKDKEIQKLLTDIHTYQSRLQSTPVVEQEYTELTRDSQAAREDYNNLLHRRSDANMAKDLEQRQQGEQFRTLDPPNLPDRPSWPNRPLIALGGFGGGMGIGFGLIMLLEVRDKSLRSEGDVEMFLKLPTLAMVPSIESERGSSGRFVFRSRKENATPASV